MKSLKVFAALTISALSALTILDALIPQVVQAQPAKGIQELFDSQRVEKVCDNRSLQGAYSVQSTGFVNNTDPFAQNGLLTYDGNGKITGTILVRSVAGQVRTNIATQGTYQVNSDCSFTASFQRTDGTTANYSGVVYDNSNKFSFTQTDPGTIANTNGERSKITTHIANTTSY
jgi:hypothetical protein